MQSFSNTPAMRSHLENQVNFMTELTHKSYDAVRRLSEIHLHLMQQSIEDAMNVSRELLACTDPFQFSQVAVRQMQPLTEHLRSYQQQLMGVISGAQVDLTRTAETHIPQTSRSANAMAEEMARNAGNLAGSMVGSMAATGSSAASAGNGAARNES